MLNFCMHDQWGCMGMGLHGGDGVWGGREGFRLRQRTTES